MAVEELACALISKALAAEAVTLDDDLHTVPGWDSLGHMAIVAELEACLGTKLTPEQIVSIASVRDVENLLAAHPKLRASS